MTRHEKIAFAGLVLFFTGLVVTGLYGYFTPVSALLCLAGLATGSFVFLPRVTRNWRLYVNMGLYSLFFTASLVTFFLILQRHPWTLDATKSKIFSISADTRNFLRQRLAEPVRVTAFVPPSQRKGAAQLLDEYARYTPHFSYQIRDPFRNVEDARRFGLEVLPGDVYLEKLTTDTQSTERVVKVTEVSEEEITNGIVQLLRGEDIVLYFLTGHDEYPLEEPKGQAQMAGKRKLTENLNWLKAQLERSRIKALPLNLAERARVPADASAVVIAGPRRDLNPAEEQALRDYVERGGPKGNGGRLFVALDPYVAVGGEMQAPLRRLTALLEDHGISLPSEIVLSAQPVTGSGDRYTIPVVPVPHRVSQLHEDQPFFFQQARPVAPARVIPPSNLVDPVLASPSQSFTLPLEELARMYRVGGKVDPEKARTGAQSLGVAATYQVPGRSEDQASKIVALGNARFLTDNLVDPNGWLLFINSVNWLTNQGDLISIPAREVENTPVTLSKPQRRFLFILLVILFPTVVGLGGLGYTLSRRELQ